MIGFDPDLVERVARAIASVHGKDPDEPMWGTDEVHPTLAVQRAAWKFYTKQAMIHISVFNVLMTASVPNAGS